MKLLLVIPCLRESARLPDFLPGLLQALRPLRDSVEVRAVDDGSGPAEQEWLTDYCARLGHDFPNLKPALLLPANAGKGGAVYAGWTAGTSTAESESQTDLAAAASSPSPTHLAFVDADGAIPPREVARLAALVINSPESAFFGIRTGGDGTRVERTLGRKLAGSVFRAIVKALFRFPLPDTQCGFKIVPASAWLACRGTLKENRFCFDVDLTWHLLRQGTPLRLVPIDWHERPGSRLRPASVWAMVKSLYSLRRRLGNWRTASAEDTASP